ncbi:MAG TPA: hypothetical protein VHC49_25825, partial [Mycobacteriales bacterium]|nr:hypothetical protein [Mycobacteriales bacterium]
MTATIESLPKSTGSSKRSTSDRSKSEENLEPVTGILDTGEKHAFIRTSGYLTGPNDVYVSLSQVRKYGLRRGDAITGAVRAPREGEQR